MTLDEILRDKSRKPKEKTEQISEWLLNETLPIEELIAFAEKQKDPNKATLIEAIEFATKQNPKIADESVWKFACQSLTAKAPRVKWESAKVIGNTAFLFSSQLEVAINNLLQNTSHEGTVVRWSAAFALGEILKLNSPHNQSLVPKIEEIVEKEEKNSIKKIYISALKKVVSKC